MDLLKGSILGLSETQWAFLPSQFQFLCEWFQNLYPTSTGHLVITSIKMLKMELHCLPLLPHPISNLFQRSHSVQFQFQVISVPSFSSSLVFYLIRLNRFFFWSVFLVGIFFFICACMLPVQALIISWRLSSPQTFHFTLYFTVSALFFIKSFPSILQ